MRAILVHNPNAGTGRHSADKLTGLLKAEGIFAAYYSTEDERYRDALRGAGELVVAAGGDGTIARVARSLRDRNVPVAILPLGTANNIACSLRIPLEPKETVASWSSAAPRDFDVGRAIGPWGNSLFLEATGAGAFADAVAAMERLKPDKKVGKKDALAKARRGFMKALKDAKPADITILADGEELPRDLLLVEVMNTTHMGPRLHLAQSADSRDGHLDVVFLPKDRRDDMLDWLKSDDGETPPVSIARARRISFEWDGAPLRIGDEMAPAKCSGSVRVDLESECLRLLAPSEAEPHTPAEGRLS